MMFTYFNKFALLDHRFQDSVDFCERHGQELLRIDNAEENEFIRSLGYDVWVDIRNLNASDYTNWVAGRRGLPADGACGIINGKLGDRDGKWYRQGCKTSFGVICQKVEFKFDPSVTRSPMQMFKDMTDDLPNLAKLLKEMKGSSNNEKVGK